jgi:multiple sugar transport system substrate-binding protein
LKRLPICLLLMVLLAVAIPTTAQDAVEVTLWHMEQPPHRVERIQELIDEFNAANPDVVVSQEVQSWGDIYQKLRRLSRLAMHQKSCSPFQTLRRS